MVIYGIVGRSNCGVPRERWVVSCWLGFISYCNLRIGIICENALDDDVQELVMAS